MKSIDQFDIVFKGKSLADVEAIVHEKLMARARLLHQDTTIRVTICADMDSHRRDMKLLDVQYAELVTSLPKSKRVWKKDGLAFDFGHDQFVWQDQAVHLTVGEKIAMIQKLCIGMQPTHWHQYRRAMKIRIGEDFVGRLP